MFVTLHSCYDFARSSRICQIWRVSPYHEKLDFQNEDWNRRFYGKNEFYGLCIHFQWGVLFEETLTCLSFYEIYQIPCDWQKLCHHMEKYNLSFRRYHCFQRIGLKLKPIFLTKLFFWLCLYYRMVWSLIKFSRLKILLNSLN